MTDKELLELAAKAAGFGAEHGATWTESEYPRGSGEHGALWNYVGHCDTAELWNPLTDDGDALRLAVKLGLAVRVLEKCVFVESDPETLLGQSSVSELEMYGHARDPYAATRRAITRAAAEIGARITTEDGK